MRFLRFVLVLLVAAVVAGCERPDFPNFIGSASDFNTPLLLEVSPNQAEQAEGLARASQNVSIFRSPCSSQLETKLEGLHEPRGFNQDDVRKHLNDWFPANGFAKQVQIRNNYSNQVYSCVVFTEKFKELKLREANTPIAGMRKANILLGRRVFKSIISQNSYEITMPMRFTVYRAAFDYTIQTDFPALEFRGAGQGVMEVYKNPQTTQWTIMSLSLSDPVPEFRNPPPPELSKDDATHIIHEKVFACFILPVGLVKANFIDPFFSRYTAALERTGIIKVVERNDQTSTMQIEFVPNVYSADLDTKDGKPCIKLNPYVLDGITKIEKIELIDSNKVPFVAYLVEVTITNVDIHNQLIARLRKEMGFPELEKLRKFRILFKYNGQNSQWDSIASDGRNATASEFETDRVGSMLRQSQSR